jgi:hypothetical protein
MELLRELAVMPSTAPMTTFPSSFPPSRRRPLLLQRRQLQQREKGLQLWAPFCNAQVTRENLEECVTQCEPNPIMSTDLRLPVCRRTGRRVVL